MRTEQLRQAILQTIHIQSRLQNGLPQLWEIIEHSSQKAKDKDSNLHLKCSFKTRIPRPLPMLTTKLFQTASASQTVTNADWWAKWLWKYQTIAQFLRSLFIHLTQLLLGQGFFWNQCILTPCSEPLLDLAIIIPSASFHVLTLQPLSFHLCPLQKWCKISTPLPIIETSGDGNEESWQPKYNKGPQFKLQFDLMISERRGWYEYKYITW